VTKRPAKAKRLPRIKTDPKALRSLPQFHPDRSFDVESMDLDTGDYHLFPPAVETEIIKILSRCVQPYVRVVEWNGKPTGLDRFLHNALRTIATYVSQRGRGPMFDRIKAKAVLLKADKTVLAAITALTEISMWRELSHYLEQLYLGAQPHERPKSETPARHKPTASAVNRAIGQADQQLATYLAFSPWTVVGRLSNLEPVLTLAVERIGFQPGDFQRDDIAQEFIDEMVVAWISATGGLPTYSKASPRSRSPSPFAALLMTVNAGILRKDLRSPNDFREYAAKSIKQMKERFPELRTVRG